ncbi:hypothetical protein [Halobellus rubicundus]|uniref:Uncharacterized protein n=1 Tax=Halobellus rubicundus TaxID=2996466 RepID=A0ABD5MBX3_9EURY
MSEARSGADSERADIEERLTVVEQRLEALQREVQTATNRDIPLLKGTNRAIMAAEIETIDELPAAGRAFGQQLVERGERLSNVEAHIEVLNQSADPSTKAEKVATVLAFAANKAGDDGKVAVTPAEIRGCTGVSRRYAYDLVEAIAADVAGVQLRESQQVTTWNGTKHKQKALLVDCEQVHGLEEAVNSFTTEEGGSEGR